MRRRRRTLRTRVAWTVAAAVLTSTVATTVVAYELERTGTRDRFVSSSAASTTADAVEVTRLAKAQPTTRAALAAACTYVAQRGNRFAVYDTGTDTCDSGALPDLPEGRSDAQGYFDFWVDGGRTWVTERIVTVGKRLPFGFAEYYDFGPELTQLRRLRDDLLLLDALAVLIAVAFGTLAAGGIARPVARVAQAFRRFGEGDLTTRIPERGSAEVAALARDFNAMADQLARTMTELQAAQTLQHRFVSDVSHELRTPLAAMVAANDALDSADEAVRARAVGLVQAQTRRLSRMIEDLLEMSRFDAGQAAMELEPVDLAELAKDVVRTVAPDGDVRVATFGDVNVVVDARRVHAILRNLVGNAVQHGIAPVDVVIDAQSDPVLVTVADDGPGVPAELAPTVFDRFVRADAARTGHARDVDAASTGLGLAIAAENARLHGATLEVSTSGRSAFTLRLPRDHAVR